MRGKHGLGFRLDASCIALIFFEGIEIDQMTACAVQKETKELFEHLLNLGNPVFEYSDIEGGWAGQGNIDLDPRFVPFPFHGFDYLLNPNSPCIDAGDPSIEDRLSDCHPRWPDWYPNGARSDMGAYGGPGNVGWIR